MNIISKTLIIFIVAFSLLQLAGVSAFADAKSAIQCGANQAAGAECTATPEPVVKVNNTITNVLNLLTTFVGIAAVVMIVIAGFRYITSGGDSTKVTSAKNALLYAVIGLVIVALAQVITRFVLSKAT